MDPVEWLLEGDPAVRWQTMRDLAGCAAADYEPERDRVASEGWGGALLAQQDSRGRWGNGLYSPKWTSTFYSMQLLRLLGLPPDNAQTALGAEVILENFLRTDGGLRYGHGMDPGEPGETCVTGMGLATLAHFVPSDARLTRIVAHLLREQMPDGGWNCQYRRGATHASFNTTILALEGLLQWEQAVAGSPEVTAARKRGEELLLSHRLFRSHRTGAVIRKQFTMLSFPGRWHYDILRALEYLVEAKAPRDQRAAEAIALVASKRRADGAWPLQQRHSGLAFFEMEPTGSSSRWNTLRALRVMRWWEGDAAGS